MSAYPELTREIEQSEEGPEIAAFFDLDRTLIQGFSALTFVRDGAMHGQYGPIDLAELAMAAASFELGTIDFSSFLTGFARLLRGMSESEFEKVGRRVFEEDLGSRIHPEARAIVDAHRRRGHTIAVVSSATRFQVEPVADDLGIEHVLASRLEVRDGLLTGEIMSPSCYGEGKAIAARSLAETIPIDLERSYFYTDSDEDLPLLDIVGNPRPTNPNGNLAKIAARRDWPAMQFTHRSRPGMAEVVRTGLAAGSLIPSLLLGLPAAYLTGDWQRAVNITASTWGELATTFAGVEVRVSGEEHLWSHRPAVFIFNHQSGLDMLLICKLLRRDFVGIGKKELQSNPILGPLMSFAGTVFVDRTNHDKAIEALGPAVDALRQGISLAIAPEGARTTTPHPTRFKKGAFRMAMEAGVPIVPIVLKNTLDALPKHWFFVRPTTIDVEVLPPVDTSDWKHEDLAERIAEIHQSYVDVLG
ncbi:MAG: HAD-IB family hydrolase [Candidatus Binatia bacterium]|nr:HAD-IB family hydrolase [Candidatus Binatia bacterium]